MKKIVFAIFALVVLISCTRELEFSSDFEFEVRNIDDTEILINTLKPFQLEILSTKNIILNKDYKFSYSVSSGSLSVKNGSDVLLMDYEYDFTVDDLNLISLDLIPETNGEINVTFYLKDNNGVVKRKDITVYCTDIDINTPFDLVKISDFSVKNTLRKEFKFTLTNTLPSATYQIKFSSINSSKIYSATSELVMNTWLEFNLSSSSSLYSFFYEAHSNTNDVLTIEVKDSYGQLHSINYNVTVFSQPIINSKIIEFKYYPGDPSTLHIYCTSNTKAYINSSVYGGALLETIRIIVKNQITGVYDTLEFNDFNLVSVSQLESNVRSCFNPDFGCDMTWLINQNISASKYNLQLYSLQIKDSDGVWSSIVNGTVTN